MIEPFCFFIIKFCSATVNSFDRKFLYQFFNGKNFLFGSIIPAQQCEEIYERFRQKSFFSESFRQLTSFWVGPVHSKNRETIFQCVAFAQFATWPEYQWKMCPLRHIFFPAHVFP